MTRLQFISLLGISTVSAKTLTNDEKGLQCAPALYGITKTTVDTDGEVLDEKTCGSDGKWKHIWRETRPVAKPFNGVCPVCGLAAQRGIVDNRGVVDLIRCKYCNNAFWMDP